MSVKIRDWIQLRVVIEKILFFFGGRQKLSIIDQQVLSNYVIYYLTAHAICLLYFISSDIENLI